MKNVIVLVLLALAAAARADEAAVQLLPLAALKYSVERVGMFTYFHCTDPKQPDCALFERLAIQPDVDWDALKAAAGKAKKKARVLAKASVVDQRGGLWIMALLGPHDGHPADFLGELTYAVVPTFPGYRVKFDDKSQVSSADVVQNDKEWKKAQDEQPKRKTGMARLLE